MTRRSPSPPRDVALRAGWRALDSGTLGRGTSATPSPEPAHGRTARCVCVSRSRCRVRARRRRRRSCGCSAKHGGAGLCVRWRAGAARQRRQDCARHRRQHRAQASIDPARGAVAALLSNMLLRCGFPRSVQLRVTYADGASVAGGERLNMVQTAAKPQVSFEGADPKGDQECLCEAASGFLALTRFFCVAFYTFMLVDPDAPDPADPVRRAARCCA